MNKIEHLLVCLGEECAEIQQAASKALRFGLDDGAPSGTTTNLEDIEKEFAELLGVVSLLKDEGIINVDATDPRIAEKKAKVLKYMEYAAQKGKLIL